MKRIASFKRIARASCVVIAHLIRGAGGLVIAAERDLIQSSIERPEAEEVLVDEIGVNGVVPGRGRRRDDLPMVGPCAGVETRGGGVADGADGAAEGRGGVEEDVS